MYSGEYREGGPIPFDDPERRVQGQSWTCSSRMVGVNWDARGGKNMVGRVSSLRR